MKLLLILALVAAVTFARPGDFYDSRYDDMNVDEITTNKRLLKSYTLCFLGEGKCTQEGTDIKKYIPDATQTSCGRCTEKQKGLSAKVIKAIKEHLPTEYEALIKQHDPDNKHREELEKYVAKYSV